MTSTDSHEERKPAQTALDLWKQNVQALANPDEAAQAMGSLYDGLMALYNEAIANGNQAQAEKAANAYNLALAIFESHQQRDVVIEGGAAAITEAEAQRQTAVDNLQDLLKAIKEGDEDHPALQDYAVEIRMDQERETLNDPWIMQEVFEQAMDSTEESLAESIMTEWQISEYQAYKLVGLMNGTVTPTPEQKELIKTLIGTLPTQITPDPLTDVFRSVGAFPAEVSDDDE